MHNLTIDNLFGRAFLRCLDLRPIEGYFNCLNLIKPLLENPNFKSSTPGFYLNVSDELNSVRLSYFTNNKTETERVIREFLNGNSNISLFRCEEPCVVKISEGYGGEELKFRKFLNTYTHIGLDLLDYDILYSRRLVAEYRLTYSPQRIPCRPLFEPAFSKHSSFFNQLDSSAVRQLWKDLDYWHSGGDWAHMLVNMLLPGDWIYMSEFTAFFLNPAPKPPIIGEAKTRLLRKFDFDIPDDWRPDC